LASISNNLKPSVKFLPKQLALIRRLWATWVPTEVEIMPQNGTKITKALDDKLPAVAAHYVLLNG
jgi:hypothetical protein